MQVKSILDKYFVHLPFLLGKEINHGGADGQVFELSNNPSMVIKLSIVFDESKTFYQKQIKPILNHLINNSPNLFVRVYGYGSLGEFGRVMPHWKNGWQDFIIHYHVMEKLFSLSDDEKKVFHTLVSHEDRNIKKDFSADKIKKIVPELARGLDFDTNMVTLFCEKVSKSPLQQPDFHPRNIMKNKDSQFKIIDLDRLILL